MSLYQFIASDYEIPEILSEKKHFPDGSDRYEFENEADLEDLDLKKTEFALTYPDVLYYTNRDYLYELDWHPRADGNIRRLFYHLREHCRHGGKLEIWQIWLANQQDPKEFRETIDSEMKDIEIVTVSADDISEEILRSELDYSNGITTPKVLRIY